MPVAFNANMKYLLFIPFLFLTSKTYCQDTLYMKNGKVALVIIKTINTKEIICKIYSKPNGVNLFISKDSIKRFSYGPAQEPDSDLAGTAKHKRLMALQIPSDPVRDASRLLRYAEIFQIAAPVLLGTGFYFSSYSVTSTTYFNNGVTVIPVTGTTYPHRNESNYFFAAGGIAEILAVIDLISASATLGKAPHKTTFAPSKDGIGVALRF